MPQQPCLKQQSPIDIDAANPISAVFPAGYFTRAWSCKLIGELVKETSGLEFKVKAGDHDGITLNHTFYQLTKYHFHARSEHYMNGQFYPLEIHFVHKIPNTPDGQGYAVVAVMVEAGQGHVEADHFFRELTKRFSVAKQSKADHVSPPLEFNPSRLLPANTNDYYRYEGSLTTLIDQDNPETVSWIIYRDTLRLSQETLDALVSVEHESKAVQCLNRRYVLRNFA